MNRSLCISKELLGSGFEVRINTRGSSMYPLISTGDKITISPSTIYDTGDMLVFKRGDSMVCHRLVKAFERDGTKYFQTRGDSFFGLDEPVTADQILGKVVRIEREIITFPRKILLLFYPALRFGRLNAFTVTALIRIRDLFSR